MSDVFPSSDRERCDIAIHDGHSHIHKDEIVHPGLELLEGNLAIVGVVDLTGVFSK
jgi:hypothetical protein